jgi:hypothetical protein
LGAKYLVVLCSGSTLPLAKQTLDEAPYKLSGAVAKLAGITFRCLAFSWIRLNLGFLLRENLLLYSSYLPLGIPNWTMKNHQHRAASGPKKVLVIVSIHVSSRTPMGYLFPDDMEQAHIKMTRQIDNEHFGISLIYHGYSFLF